MIEHPASISALIWPTFTDFAAGCSYGCEAGRPESASQGQAA
jgi:hypothetical protein